MPVYVESPSGNLRAVSKKPGSNYRVVNAPQQYRSSVPVAATPVVRSQSLGNVAKAEKKTNLTEEVYRAKPVDLSKKDKKSSKSSKKLPAINEAPKAPKAPKAVVKPLTIIKPVVKTVTVRQEVQRPPSFTPSSSSATRAIQEAVHLASQQVQVPHNPAPIAAIVLFNPASTPNLGLNAIQLPLAKPPGADAAQEPLRSIPQEGPAQGQAAQAEAQAAEAAKAEPKPEESEPLTQTEIERLNLLDNDNNYSDVDYAGTGGNYGDFGSYGGNYGGFSGGYGDFGGSFAGGYGGF